MRATVLAFIVAVLTLAPEALAQSGPLPRGNDDVLLARIYRKTSVGTDPIGRLGVVVSGKSGAQSLEMPAAAGQAAATLSLKVSPKGDGARVEWQVQSTGGGAALPSASGTVNVASGGLSRVTLRQWTGGELFASLEAGRASSFDSGRLAQHFGSVPWGLGLPATETVGVAPVLMPTAGGGLAIVPAAALAAAPSDRAKGPALEVQCPGGSTFLLALDSGHGECRSRFGSDGSVTGATCSDPEGDAAEVDCLIGSGRGACVRTAGNGSCKQK